MAEKKIFTGYTFSGGGQTKNLRLEAIDAAPTNVGLGHLYFNTTTSLPQVSTAASGATWATLLTAEVDYEISGNWTFNRGTSTAPFTLHDNAKKQYVTGLKAEYLGNSSETLSSTEHRVSVDAAAEHGIPVYGTNGVLKVGTPVADGDAAPKVYVDTAVQGLDHKESVKYTTTGNITLENVTPAQSNLDIGTAIVEGDRVLVKNQTNASQNGIYIAKHNDDWERATDADYGVELVTNGTDFTGGPPPTGWTETSPALLTADDSGGSNWRLKVANTSAGNHGDARQSFAVEVGKSYKVTVTAEIGTAADYQIKIGSTNAGQDYFYEEVTADATKVVVFTARTALLSIRLQNSGEASTHCFFDNISAKEADLNEGAFVFVEEGDTKPNTSWVMSATNVWTQFSGAGQLDVTSNGAASTAPLTKSGDTIDFSYSLDNALSTTSAVDLLLNGTAWTAATGGTPPTSWTLGGWRQRQLHS